jgi:hypothetical protein
MLRISTVTVVKNDTSENQRCAFSYPLFCSASYCCQSYPLTPMRSFVAVRTVATDFPDIPAIIPARPSFAVQLMFIVVRYCEKGFGCADVFQHVSDQGLFLARTGHVDRVARCLLSGEKRKTSTRSEYFRV